MAGMEGRVKAIQNRILSCVDDQNNVINPAMFEEAITELESLQIDHQVLLTTSIGKFINNLRKQLGKNSSDRNLGKRIKELVRVWFEVVKKRTDVSSNGSISSNSPQISSAQGSPALQKSTTNGLNGHGSGGSPLAKPPGSVPVNSGSGRITLKLAVPKKDKEPKPDVEIVTVPDSPSLPQAKRFKGIITISDSRSNSPLIVPADTNSSRDGLFDGDSNSTPTEVHPAIPARLRPPAKRLEKVKSHQELLSEFRREMPGAISHIELPPVDICDESRSTSSSSVMPHLSKDNRKRKKMEPSESQRTQSSSSISPETPPAPAHPRGRGPDPIDAELAAIMRELDVLSPDQAGVKLHTGSNGSVERGWTETFVDSTRTGEKVVVLPYVYFPFHPSD